jgi:uncharacterized integral membrane protein
MVIDQQEKIIQALSGLVMDEASELTKLRQKKRVTQLAGGMILLLAFTLVFQDSESPLAWLYALGSACGGILIGMSICYERSLLTWPILRDFLDRDRLRSSGLDGEK